MSSNFVKHTKNGTTPETPVMDPRGKLLWQKPDGPLLNWFQYKEGLKSSSDKKQKKPLTKPSFKRPLQTDGYDGLVMDFVCFLSLGDSAGSLVLEPIG